MNMKKSGLILILVIAFSSAFAYSTNAAELLVESDSSVQPRIIMCSCGGRTAPESIFSAARVCIVLVLTETQMVWDKQSPIIIVSPVEL